MKNFFPVLMCNLNFLILLWFISFSSNTSLEEFRNALKEVAYSYYMRGKNIQYNLGKIGSFSPEDATEQNMNFMVCATFVRNVYRELLNITLPFDAQTLVYTKENLGKPEVIVYSYKNNKNEPVLLLYTPGEKNYLNLTNNFSVKDIIATVQIGDILTYSGHTKLIYDLEKDNEGNVIDAYIMESTGGIARSYINSKIVNHHYIYEGQIISAKLSKLFLNSKLNTDVEEGRVEASVGLKRLSSYGPWANINNKERKYNEYSILRIMQNGSKGKPVLKFKTTYPNSPNQFLDNDELELSKKNLDRLKFKHLYIEKTVNKNADNIVLLGDILNYKLIIINYSKKDYTDDLIVNENIPEFVEFVSHYETKNVVSFNFNKADKKLIWNIGKLKKEEKIIINFLVKIISGKPGDKIISNGFVGNIESSKIINTIGINLNQNQKNEIIETFDKLKNKYSGKKLINEIYKSALNVDLKFDNFDITKLIYNTKLNSPTSTTIGLYQNSSFYGAVLNKYWSSMATLKYKYIEGVEEVDIFASKYFRDYNKPERRADFIYKETLQTGDILFYLNRNDATYKVDDKNQLIKTYYTYEEGEYAYIYIENKGFVGVNLGDDGKKNTKDDRNEFNAKYYKDNNLNLYAIPPTNITDELLEISNLQTLFGKDYYVILRPSLSYIIPTNNNNNTNLIAIILPLIFIIIIVGCGICIFLKYLKIKKKGKKFNFINLKQELLFNYKLYN